MSANDPSITASSIITDVEARLGTPNISTTTYLPWISYAYQKVYAALTGVGQDVKERLFGSYTLLTLTNGTAEYTITTVIPRFVSLIKSEILYGGTGDDWVIMGKLASLANWNDQSNVTTSDWPKTRAMIYQLKNVLGVIPTPPASDASQAQMKVWYIQGSFQITDGADVIDIPYRYLYPISNYVHSKAIEKKFEDYSTAAQVEAKFERELEQIALAASGETNENDDTNAIQDSASSPIYDNPLRTS